ncbi:MAG TPA: flagellar export chaperone FliS [Symbiobacteriaceae bacterium]|nr:flagellar export chaperone FliS [Symbiobacteriaceae bacterium]
MPAPNPYRNVQLDVASPEDSVALLYDGIRRFVDQALLALQAGKLEQVSYNVGKAQQILGEMSACLNFEVEISKNLYQLYEYWSWRLGQGLIKQEPAAFQEVSAVLADMREAWADAARQVRAQRALRAHG